MRAMKGDISADSILVYIGSNADDAIGENIIKLPFLRALGDAFAEARITWIAGLGPANSSLGRTYSTNSPAIHEPMNLKTMNLNRPFRAI